jgi:SH3 domain protein
MAVSLIYIFPISYSSAEDIYVTGVTNITMRTGPGVDHKIVRMLKSGTKLEIVEHKEDWSHVRTIDGKQGWVLSRFLTPKVPDALLVNKLEIENQRLMEKLAAIEEENKQLTVKNATLVQLKEKYTKLKKESGQFLELKANYNEMTEQFENQKKKIEKLENDSKNEIKFWFLIGPGVLIIGFIFGLSTRKKKRSSLL